jgi:AcrR family transcriptional regulator
MGEGGQGNRRLPAEARRLLILDAAREAILARGLAAVSVREIARAARLSSGTVTHHFASVDEILTAVLRRESERFRQGRTDALAARRTALDGLLALGDRLLADDPEVRDYWSLWLDHWARAAHDPALAEWQFERYRAWRELTTGLVEEGVERGEFRPVDTPVVAAELIALIDGLAIQAFFETSGLTPAGARGVFHAAVRARLPPAGAASV